MSGQIQVLSLPTEIRMMIWDRAVETSCIHFDLHDQIPFHKLSAADWCEYSQTCMNLKYQEGAIAASPATKQASWYHCCRQVYLETKALRWQRTLVSFGRAKNVLQAIGRLPQSLLLLHRVHLHLGPAKFATDTDERTVKQALLMLSSAPCLRQLHLTAAYYYQADTDEILLSDSILDPLLRFKHLHSLFLAIDRPPPGPTGAPDGPQVLEALHSRLTLLETVLSRHICHNLVLDGLQYEHTTTTSAIQDETLKLFKSL